MEASFLVKISELRKPVVNKKLIHMQLEKFTIHLN